MFTLIAKNLTILVLYSYSISYAMTLEKPQSFSNSVTVWLLQGNIIAIVIRQHNYFCTVPV